jgi:CheY-like chemotaxis protein
VALVKLGSRVLRKLGYVVTGHSDARKALEEFRATPDAFDVVITDVAMPGWSGFDLAREFRALRPTLPILMTSGNLSGRDREEAQELGVRHMLQKPHGTEDLARALHAALHP